MADPRYINKMGSNGNRNYLFILENKYTRHIGWLDFGNGPIVYSNDLYEGRPNQLDQRGYVDIDPATVARILTAAMNDLEKALPSKVFS